MLIQNSYHGAAGALLVARQKFEEAVPQLEDDENNPFSLELLSRAYSETGAFDKMHEVEAKLRGTNLPTMGQVLAVSPAALAPRIIREHNDLGCANRRVPLNSFVFLSAPVVESFYLSWEILSQYKNAAVQTVSRATYCGILPPP